MHYFFQKEFIATVKHLLKKKSYNDCEKALIDGVFLLLKPELFNSCSANRLNPSAKNPIVKIRIACDKGKSSSYRLYFFAVFKDEKLYFGHIYPKTGTKGQAALSKKEENRVIKALLEDVKSNSTVEVFLDEVKNKICSCSTKKEIW